jgi:hypothetical protein
MNNLCQPCHDKLLNMGRDVELCGSRPLMARPCVMCGEPTESYLVSWSNWERAPYYPVEKK